MKKHLKKYFPFVLAWAMALITAYFSKDVSKGLDAVISVIELFK